MVIAKIVNMIVEQFTSVFYYLSIASLKQN